MKTGNESIEAIIRRRRILFAGFVARMEVTRLPKCVIFGKLVGDTGCVGGAGKRVDGVFPGRPQSFLSGIFRVRMNSNNALSLLCSLSAT